MLIRLGVVCEHTTCQQEGIHELEDSCGSHSGHFLPSVFMSWTCSELKKEGVPREGAQTELLRARVSVVLLRWHFSTHLSSGPQHDPHQTPPQKTPPAPATPSLPPAPSFGPASETRPLPLTPFFFLPGLQAHPTWSDSHAAIREGCHSKAATTLQRC